MLTELPTPAPHAGEVLVRVQSSSVNGFDTAVAAGYLTGMMEHRFPVVLGIATARPGEETDFLRGLGAANVVDYTGDVAAQVLAISPDGVDVVVHLAGDGAILLGLLADGGRLASTLGLGPDQHPAATAVMAAPTGETLDRLAADAVAGRITVPVSRSYPLAEVPNAFADFATGTVGKLAVTIA